MSLASSLCLSAAGLQHSIHLDLLFQVILISGLHASQKWTEGLLPVLGMSFIDLPILINVYPFFMLKQIAFTGCSEKFFRCNLDWMEASIISPNLFPDLLRVHCLQPTSLNYLYPTGVCYYSCKSSSPAQHSSLHICVEKEPRERLIIGWL